MPSIFSDHNRMKLKSIAEVKLENSNVWKLNNTHTLGQKRNFKKKEIRKYLKTNKNKTQYAKIYRVQQKQYQEMWENTGCIGQQLISNDTRTKYFSSLKNSIRNLNAFSSTYF